MPNNIKRNIAKFIHQYRIRYGPNWRRINYNIIKIIFNETSSLGIRIQEVNRLSLSRKNIQVDVEACKINVKIGLLNGKVANIAPEYEDCKSAAKKLNLPLKQIYQLATDQSQKTKLT